MNKQCEKCVHADVCKHIDEIDELKEEYEFIDSVTCKKFLKPGEMPDKPAKTTRSKKTAVETNPANTVDSTDATNADDKKQSFEEFADLPLSKIYIPADIVNVLSAANINTVKDVVEYSAAGKNWHEIKNLSNEKYIELRSKLEAFNITITDY